jgi:tetratricopeptide (TPR) repeat protein
VRKALPETTFALILGLALLVYWPGLSGGFLFDDFVNLPALGAYGPVDNATAFWRYLTSGNADPTGRPLALLSFLVDARTWPADPWPFKRTNVLLHLFNGALLFLLLKRLGLALARPDRGEDARAARWAAVVGAALWVLHPLLVSTTLYVVQREAMLPATFVLLGLLGYLAGRSRAREGHASGVFIAGASIAACTGLGVLSKANGALLPMFAWILEAILLAPAAPVANPATASRFRAMTRLVLVLPSLAVIAWLAYAGAKGFIVGTAEAHRPWTLGERLLTEARIVVDYLALLWIPHPYSRGLFNDGYAISTGLLAPPSTLACAVLLAALVALAFAVRRRHAALSAAILFFFAGHLMESSVIPLELYFEHRNYAPALLMFWPLARWLTAPSQPATLFALRRTLAVALPHLLAGLTFYAARLWGNVAEQGLLWAALNPESPRAQAYAAQIEMARGYPAVAEARLRPVLAESPDEIQIALNLVDARCRQGALAPADLDAAATSLRTTRKLVSLAFDWIDRHVDAAKACSCAGLDLAALERLVDAMAANPQVAELAGRRQDVASLRGRIALARGNAQQALAWFDAAFDADPTPEAALHQSALLAASGHADFGILHLDRAARGLGAERPAPLGMPRIHAWLLRRQGYWNEEFRKLRSTMLSDAAAAKRP